MNRAQRRAQWQTRFRQRSGNIRGGSVVGEPSYAAASNASTARDVCAPQHGSVRLRIEELQLRGFERGRETAIANGLESALTRMLAERGVPNGWIQTRSFERTKPVVLCAGQKSLSIGEHVARALFELPDGGRR